MTKQRNSRRITRKTSMTSFKGKERPQDVVAKVIPNNPEKKTSLADFQG